MGDNPGFGLKQAYKVGGGLFIKAVGIVVFKVADMLRYVGIAPKRNTECVFQVGTAGEYRGGVVTRQRHWIGNKAPGTADEQPFTPIYFDD